MGELHAFGTMQVVVHGSVALRAHSGARHMRIPSGRPLMGCDYSFAITFKHVYD